MQTARGSAESPANCTTSIAPHVDEGVCSRRSGKRYRWRCAQFVTSSTLTAHPRGAAGSGDAVIRLDDSRRAKSMHLAARDVPFIVHVGYARFRLGGHEALPVPPKFKERAMKFATILQWMARLLSLALAVLFVIFGFGQGLPQILPASIHTLSLGLIVLCQAGLLLAWRFELVGAIIGLLAAACFYLVDFGKDGHSFPSGWVFPLLLMTPLPYLIAFRIKRRPDMILPNS